MANDEVVVKKDGEGNVTVCIGDRCVKVPCAEEEDEVEVGRPPIRVEVMEPIDAIGDLNELEWEQAAPGVEMAQTPDGSQLTRRQVG